MSQLTSDSWLSSDHTFKVAANIGFFWNNRWVKVYDSLFIVLNEIGMVLTWLLTKGTKFENVENLLNNLQKRFLTKGKILKLYIIDKCCSWRNKLYSVFGNDHSVKLDPFHAIQRVLQCVPKRKGVCSTMMSLRKKCVKV